MSNIIKADQYIKVGEKLYRVAGGVGGDDKTIHAFSSVSDTCLSDIINALGRHGYFLYPMPPFLSTI